MADLSKIGERITRVLTWCVGCAIVIALVWLVANRLFDEPPDPRRDAFLRSGDTEIPDEKNIAVGVAGLGAPSGADFMKFGADIKKLYEGYAAWPDIERKTHVSDELRLTVETEQMTCWTDPDWEGWKGWKGCLPFDRAPQVLADNRELLERYKLLYRLDRNVNFGFLGRNLIPLTKLAVAEMRLDMKSGHYEAAYAKWRDQFRFTRKFLRGQDNWVGKSIGMVDFGMSLPVIEDLLVKRPSLARVHFEDLLDLLQPEGIELIDPAGLARAEYLHLEYFLKAPYTEVAGLSGTFDWLIWRLGQQNRVRNQYLAYSMDYSNVLRQPWARLPDEFSRMSDRHVPLGWKSLVDPFGSILLLMLTQWQVRPTETLRQAYILDGKVRLATLVVRMIHDSVRDEEIPAFLAKASPALHEPFSNGPMRWDAKNGRIYFISGDDGCDISPFRVPVWDAKSSRRPPKYAEWTIC